jgi:hypothetical protein
MGIIALIVIWPLREKLAADFISPWVINPDETLMRRCQWLGYSHKNVDSKRKKVAKKEKVVIIVVD